MIKINVNKKKTIEFDVNIVGVQCEALSGRLSLFYEGLIYSFPAIIEDANVIKVELPPLIEIIHDIPNKYQAVLKLEVVGKDTFMMPWSGSAHLEHPIQVEATMRGTKLDEEEVPKIEVSEIREEEQDTKACPEGQQWCPVEKKCVRPGRKKEDADVDEAKYDTKSMADFTGTARSKKIKKKKKDSKLAKALDKEGEEKKKEDEKEEKKKEPKKLGEALAKALLGESKSTIENHIRDHLSGTNRTVTKESMWKLVKSGVKGAKQSDFNKAWKELVDEDYLGKSGKGYKWEG